MPVRFKIEDQEAFERGVVERRSFVELRLECGHWKFLPADVTDDVVYCPKCANAVRYDDGVYYFKRLRLVPNDRKTPAKSGSPNEGVVFPYWTAAIGDESVTAAFYGLSDPGEIDASEGMRVAVALRGRIPGEDPWRVGIVGEDFIVEG